MSQVVFLNTRVIGKALIYLRMTWKRILQGGKEKFAQDASITTEIRS